MAAVGHPRGSALCTPRAVVSAHFCRRYMATHATAPPPHHFGPANAFKEGDLRLGGSRDEQVRTEARQALAALRLQEIMATPCVADDVSDALRRALNPALVHDIEHLTIAEVG